MDLRLVSEELAFIRSEMKRLNKAFMEAAHNQYNEKASEFRFEKHMNKLRLHELKYNCLVYLGECEFKWYRWKQLQEARLFMQREFD